MSYVLQRNLYIGAPAEMVWEWLVNPERVREYAPVELAARPEHVGDPIEYRSKLSGNVIARGVVQEILAPRKLVHTYEMELPFPEGQTTVEYELLQYGDRMCCLRFRHEGLQAGTETYSSAQTGWDVILSSLKTIIETGQPLPWPSRHTGPIADW